MGAEGVEVLADLLIPSTVWTAADIAKCQELVKRDSMPGFNVEIKKPYYIWQI